MGSAGFFIAGIVILALVAAGVGFYLYQRKGNGDTARLFAPRTRRLAYVERTALEGGRKLLLVRRDDVEHLILIGGPIDLVVEFGHTLRRVCQFLREGREFSANDICAFNVAARRF